MVHEGQQDAMQRLQERAGRVRKLEEVCRKQEKVIERMERLLNEKRPSSQGGTLRKAHSART